MTTVAEIPASVKPSPAEKYRAHLFGDCWACAGGHWCSTRERLDYLAACDDARRSEASRG